MATEPSPSLILNADIAEEFEQEIDGDVLRDVLSRALSAHGVNGEVEVSLVVTDDAELRDLNREYRGVDAATDVLSFAQLDSGPDAAVFPTPVRQLGDIVISGDRVREQARDYGHSQRRELAYLAVHGLLHLLGYDHETSEEKETMRQAEEQALESVPR